MKYYSEFTTEYVDDICKELSVKGVIADKIENKPFAPLFGICYPVVLPVDL